MWGRCSRRGFLKSVTGNLVFDIFQRPQMKFMRFPVAVRMSSVGCICTVRASQAVEMSLPV